MMPAPVGPSSVRQLQVQYPFSLTLVLFVFLTMTLVLSCAMMQPFLVRERLW